MTTISLTPYLGEGLLNVGDFFKFESVLHPVAIGSIAILFLFIWLRLSSNRTVAPLTIWDEICSIALGSTLAGIINGQPLVRGLLALVMLLIWQYLTSWLGCRFPKAGILFTKPPMVVAFRGHLLHGVMRRHRITEVDLYGALRNAGIFNICEIEVVVVEPTGVFSVFRSKDMPKEYDPDVLLSIKGYRELVKADEEEKRKQKEEGVRRNSSSDGGASTETRHGDQSDQGKQGKRGEDKPKDEKGETREDKIACDAA